MTEQRRPAIFRTDDGEFQVQVDGQRETVWATKKQIAEFFACDKTNVLKHIQAIYAEGELDRQGTAEDFAVVQDEGGRQVSRTVEHFNLDVILAVGYRVNTRQATAFRQWATSTLHDHLEHGYTINPSMLAENQDAQRELWRQLRAIRTSEQSIYQRVREVFKESATDYDPNSQSARSFYAMAQDKFHYAITGQTAAQILLTRATSRKPNLGMTDGSVSVTVTHAKVAKNYLNDEELQALENISEQFLLFAESKAFRRQPMTMEELSFRLNTLLTANDYPVLFQYESYQRDEADEHVRREVEAYRALPEGSAG